MKNFRQDVTNSMEMAYNQTKESLMYNFEQKRKKIRAIENKLTEKIKQAHHKEVMKWYKKNIKRKDYFKSLEKFFIFFRPAAELPDFMPYKEEQISKFVLDYIELQKEKDKARQRKESRERSKSIENYKKGEGIEKKKSAEQEKSVEDPELEINPVFVTQEIKEETASVSSDGEQDQPGGGLFSIFKTNAKKESKLG